jgi:ABC-2 type transport system ATP-binding protein
MIKAHAISKHFGRVVAVDKLDLAVPKGSICGLLGPNGAGKTTTIRMLSGVLPPDSGSLEVAGFDMPGERRHALARIGYLPEAAPSYPEMRVEAFLHFRGRLLGLDRSDRTKSIREAMGSCGIESVARRLIGELSKGFRQRVGLAAALIGSPQLLVLDEPTVGLDPRQLLEFRGLLRGLSQTKTILLSSHIMQEIDAVCDRVVVMHQGRKLAEGTRAELLELLGARARIIGEAAGERESLHIAVRRAAAGVEVSFRDLDDGTIHFEFSTNHDPRAVIGAVVADMGGAIRALERREPTLEEMFFDLLDLADEERGA